MKTIKISNETLLKIKHGIKSRHGCLNNNEFNKIKLNDKILLKSEFSDLLVKINNIEKFDTYVKLACTYGIDNIIINSTNTNDSLQKYLKNYLDDKKNKYGGIMFTFEPISSISLTNFK